MSEDGIEIADYAAFLVRVNEACLGSDNKEQKVIDHEIAEKIGVERSTFTNYRNGERQFPSRKIKAFADFRGVRIEWLLTGQLPKWKKDDFNHILPERAKEMLLKMEDTERASTLESLPEALALGMKLAGKLNHPQTS